MTAKLSERSQHVAETSCKLLWGSKLSSLPFTFGDNPIHFSSLWPDKRHFVEVYKEANLEQECYSLCALLVVTNGTKCLAALLEDGALHVNHCFGGAYGNVTLAHLACALGSADIVQVLLNQSASRNGIWALKDDEDHTAVDICFSQELRKSLPNKSLFRKKTLTGVVLRTEIREKIFKLAAQPCSFYKVIVLLQIFLFDVNKERNGDGDLLIHIAVKGGLPSLPLLLALVNVFKADISARDAGGLTPLSLAAKIGEEKVAEVLVCVLGADINSPEKKNRWTPLHLAVQNNHPQVVSMLVRRGADADSEDKNKQVPSFLAQRCQALECRQIILQHLKDRAEMLAEQAKEGTLQTDQLYPSDACLTNSEGYTLLMLAAQHNHEALLRDLLKIEKCPLDYRHMKPPPSNGSDCSHFPDSDHTGKTAVHLAAEEGHVGCLKILLSANAHPSIRDSNAWLPLHYACDNGHVECVRAITSCPSHHLGLCGLQPALDLAEGGGYGEIVAILQDAYDRRQKKLIAPMLFEVACTGKKDLLFKIWENGDDINPTNESDDWPLFLAAGSGYLDVVKQLQEFGGHVTHCHCKLQSTPLHVAARGGHIDVVRYLLNFCHPRSCHTHQLSQSSSSTPIVGLGETTKDLNINQRNAAGATPLELAASQGHSDVVSLLLAHGASTTLPDSTGRQLRCVAFSGTQFLIETHRKERMKKILHALRHRTPLQEFEKIWQGPSDFNLRKNSDTLLMIAAQYSSPEIVRFLIQSAASCKPGMLLLPSGEPLPLQCFSSMEESDFSDQSLPATPLSHYQRGHRRTYSFESSGERPSTAIPFRGTPPRPRNHHGKWPPPNSHRPPTNGRSKSVSVSSATTTGSSGEEGEEEGGTQRPTCLVATTGPHIDIIRLTSPRDGQTALHRAASSDQHDIVSLLLTEDPLCANIQDKEGNTALHLACRKAHKRIVNTLLDYPCVSTRIRNCKMELPEEGCPKPVIRKKVCKHRETQVKQSFPSPPVTPSEFHKPSVGLTPITNGGEHWHQELSGIPESTTTTDSLSFSALNSRLEQVKNEFEQKKLSGDEGT